MFRHKKLQKQLPPPLPRNPDLMRLFHISRILFVSLVPLMLCVLALPAVAQDKQEINWNEINTLGLYTTAEEGRLSDNIWDDYSQDRALQTLNNYPHTLRNPAYRSVVKKILLSHAPALDEDVESPALLARRLAMLVQYGLFAEAEELYKKVGDTVHKDYSLALIGLALTLKDGSLAPACLDIQASTTQFRDMPAWRELAQYCALRFEGGDTFKNDSLSFKQYPLFNVLLMGDLVSLPYDMSYIETLVAFADNRIPDSLYNRAAQNIDQQSDIFISMALSDRNKEKPTYRCYAIEAAARGLIQTETLADIYMNTPFDKDDLTGKNGAVTMHPCDVPAFFYQRVNKSDNKKAELELMLGSTGNISAFALSPFADILAQHMLDERYLWQAGIILGISGKPLPDHVILSPLRTIIDSNQIRHNDAIAWKEAVQSTASEMHLPQDIALPVYYSRSSSVDFLNFAKNKDEFNYENFFSLTYSRKSLHSAIGMTDTMSAARRHNDIPRLFLVALSQAGSHDPKDMEPRAIAGILSSLNDYKLDNEKHMLAFDALHY